MTVKIYLGRNYATKRAAAAATADENVVEFKALPLKGEGWEGVSGVRKWSLPPNPLTLTLSPAGERE
jgi:hypothetical protein